MIDTDASPGDYAPYFERAPTYGESLPQTMARLQAEIQRAVDEVNGITGITEVIATARCYRDRQTRAKLIATTNEIRAKYGMPEWRP